MQQTMSLADMPTFVSTRLPRERNDEPSIKSFAADLVSLTQRLTVSRGSDARLGLPALERSAWVRRMVPPAVSREPANSVTRSEAMLVKRK